MFFSAFHRRTFPNYPIMEEPGIMNIEELNQLAKKSPPNGPWRLLGSSLHCTVCVSSSGGAEPWRITANSIIGLEFTHKS